MQKNLLLLLCLGIFTTVDAQVGVGTTTPHSTLDVRGSLAAGYRAFSANTTALPTDNPLVFTGTVAATLTLPDAVACTGRMYWVKTTGSTPLTITTTSAQTIDGAATWPMSGNKTLKLVSNGANWVITAETFPGGGGSAGVSWVPGGNNLATAQNLGTTSNTDLPFITNNTEKMRLSSTGRLEIGNSTAAGNSAAIVTRTSTSPATNYDPTAYSNYNGGVIQSTYPGGLTGQNLNIAATGANTGNWPSNIVFFTRNNGGTNATQKMQLSDDGKLEVGTSTSTFGPAITTRSATSPNANFDPTDYSNYNGGVMQSTYPGGFTGQNLNIAATGANTGNWPCNIVFFTRNNGGTNTSQKLRL